VNEEEKRLYIKLAYGYYQNKEYKKAIELYEKLHKSDPDDFNVTNMLGDTYNKAKAPKKALEAYIDTMSTLERKGQNARTVKLAKKISRNFPDDNRVKNKLKNAMRLLMRDADRKSMHHEYQDARDILESIKEFSSEEYPVEFKLRQIEEEEKKYNERQERLQEKKPVKKEDSQQELIEKFDKMAQNYLNNGDFDGAVETYITALKLAPGNEDLRSKLHGVYVTIAQESAGEKVWQKIDGSPKDKIAEAKQRALEERHAKIIKEEEERAKQLLSDEDKIQQEYEQKEQEIIQAAATELKHKLDEAQKKQKLKEEEIQRIMREQEAKKRELLEKIKREAVEKFKKQKEKAAAAAAAEKSRDSGLRDQVEEKKPEPPVAPLPPVQPLPDLPEKETSGATSKLLENLRKTYQKPKIGEGADKPGAKPIKIELPPNPAAPPSAPAAVPVEAAPPEKDDVEVNEDTLDSLLTTAFIYVNQGLIKEALRIYNKVSEKYPDHPEAKQLITEITKKGKG